MRLHPESCLPSPLHPCWLASMCPRRPCSQGPAARRHDCCGPVHFLFLVTPCWLLSLPHAVRGLSLADMTVLAERTITDDLEYLISQTVDPSKADYAGAGAGAAACY